MGREIKHQAPTFLPSKLPGANNYRKEVMRMTKKDYEVVAFALALAEPLPHNKREHEAWRLTRNTVSSTLKYVYPNFDEEVFRSFTHMETWDIVDGRPIP